MAIWRNDRGGLNLFQQRVGRSPIWAKSIVIAICTYVVALLLVFPKYFEPLSPFHSDFFDYVSKADLSGWDILINSPRPIAFFTMYALGHFGVTGLLAAEIPIAIGSILLMRRYVEVAYGFDNGRLWQFTIYAILVFSQQQFYFMYRHDLPFLVEFASLLVSLLFWQAAKGKYTPIAICAAVCFAFISAFSKETLYLVGPALLLLPCLVSLKRLKANVAAAAVLLIIEYLCHLRGGPFSGSSDPASPYYVDVALPGLIRRTFAYVLLLATPINTTVFVVAVAVAKHRLVAIGFAVIAILALIPNSALPNHIFEEYAWSGMPFLLAPVLLQMRAIPQFTLRISTVAILLALIFISPKPTDGSSWMIYQEKITTNVYDGVSSLALLPLNSIILIVPPRDAPFAFWHAPSYVTHRFTNHNRLEVLDPKQRPVGFALDAPVTYGGLDDFISTSISYVARFNDAGALVSIEPLPKAQCEVAEEAMIAPIMQTWIKDCSLKITDSKQAIAAGQAFLSVGAWNALKKDRQLFPKESALSDMINVEPSPAR